MLDAGRNAAPPQQRRRSAGHARACAAAAMEAGLCGRRVRVRLRGGALEIEWRERDGHILMTGPAVTVFEGELID